MSKRYPISFSKTAAEIFNPASFKVNVTFSYENLEIKIHHHMRAQLVKHIGVIKTQQNVLTGN